MYSKVIEKIICYVSHIEIWFKDTVKQYIKLLQLQRTGLLNLKKCYRSVSTEALQVLAGIEVLDIKLRNCLKLYMLKTKEIDTNINNLFLNFANLEVNKTFVHVGRKYNLPERYSTRMNKNEQWN
ncbi:hypothetical protein CDAR_97541 [Caerostris darwini]|uniref:Uncharacterized protein n=1 Tax=Caerostris darwini TaxID=1538125 RepID=A0AAV4PPW9_9ARAC|nr:hypothetical protein CDAR_97541 [Caerostris darwini]